MFEGGPAAFGARPPHQAYLMGRPHGGAGIPIVPQTCTKVHTVKTILRKEKFRAVQKNFPPGELALSAAQKMEKHKNPSFRWERNPCNFPADVV